MSKNPFVRTNDEHYDAYVAMKTFMLIHAHRKWGTVRIRKIIYRGDAPWSRMDIVFESLDGGRPTQSEVGEFMEHYGPDGIGKFDADKFLTKVDQFYGPEYIFELG